MKKLWIVIMLAALLAGCKSEQTFETLADAYSPQTPVSPKKVEIAFAEQEDYPVIENENGKLYLCDGYEVALQILSGGDLQETVRTLTGFQKDKLTVLETGTGDAVRYECVWTAAGEQGDIVARCAILDDGFYHYCMTMTADAQNAGALQPCWGDLLQSFSLA